MNEDEVRLRRIKHCFAAGVCREQEGLFRTVNFVAGPVDVIIAMIQLKCVQPPGDAGASGERR